MTQENNGGNWSQQVWQQSAAPGFAPSQPAPQGQPASAPVPAPAPAAGQPQPAPAAAQPRPYAPYPQAAYLPPAYAAQPAAAAPVGAAPAAPAHPQKKRGWIVALVAVILSFVLMLFGMVSCSTTITEVMNPFAGFDMAQGSAADMLVDDTVAVIEITGEITYDWSNCSPEGLKYQLDAAEENDHIKAVVLRINSGGGSATAGEEMSAYVRDFSKPIVVSSASTNASAAYEISSQTDYIFVGQTTLIGSIGVAIQLTDLSGLYEKLGINIENITSAENKDSSYGTRPLTEEERAHYQAIVDQINETFIQTVAEGRGMSVEDVRALATGLSFTGLDAVENGLADEVGGLDAAMDKAAELAGIGSYEVIYLEPDYSYDIASLLGLNAGSTASDADAVLLEGTNHDVIG